MDRFRIKGLRSLADTKEIEIKPLTILVGENGTGKSTFLRSFPLLKQSVNTDTREPIRWYEKDLVDFGSFTESLTTVKNGNYNEMEFSFSIPFPKEITLPLDNYFRSYYFFDEFVTENEEEDSKSLLINLFIKEKDSESQVSKVIINFDNIEIVLDYLENKLFIYNQNEKPIEKKFQSIANYRRALIPQISFNKDSGKNMSFLETEKFIEWIKANVRRKLKNETITNSIKTFNLDTKEGLIKQLENRIETESTRKTLKEFYSELIDSESKLEKFISQFVLCTISPLIDYTNKKLFATFTDVNYIAPVRASAERFYRVQGLSINTIDPQGVNVSEYLNDLKKNTQRNTRWRSWTLENFGFEFTVEENHGHIGIYVLTSGNNRKVNLADTGFGYSQILPILIQLWQAIENRSRTRHRGKLSPTIIAIEQPELHLHPAFQAKLMDAFINCIKLSKEKNIDLRIIIETHSETMLNRIGLQIVHSDFDLEKLINVLLFEKSKENISTIRKAEFGKEGYLKSWPIGFFEPDGV